LLAGAAGVPRAARSCAPSAGCPARPGGASSDTLLTAASAIAGPRPSSEVERLERREVALQQACRALYCWSGTPASVVRNFLENYWVHVLAKVAYRHGSDSPEWATRLHTANRLLASASPPGDGACSATARRDPR
jgi:hypothetical protein